MIAAAGATALAAAPGWGADHAMGRQSVSSTRITCIIRYVIDPIQRDAFEGYARSLAPIVRRCGGDVVGFFIPDEGADDVAFALISFPSLAAYETAETRLDENPQAIASRRSARQGRFILGETRTFLRDPGGTSVKRNVDRSARA